MELLMFILGAVTVLFIQFLMRNKSAKKVMKTIHNPIVEATYQNGIMTVKYHNGQVSKYKGSSTVWHSYPLMKRIGTLGEGRLSEIYQYIKSHGNPYPTAHEKLEQEKKNAFYE